VDAVEEVKIRKPQILLISMAVFVLII